MGPPKRATIAAAVLATMAACSDEIVNVQPPTLSDARSLLVVFGLDPPRVFAMELASAASLQIPLGDDEVRVVVLFYRQELGALGLEAGEQTLAAEGRALPAPDEVRASTVGETAGAWEEGPPPDWVNELRLAGDPCATTPRFRVITRELETRTNGRDAIDMGDRTALLTAEDGTFYRMDSSRFERVTFTPTPPSGAVYRAENGDLYFAGGRGALWHMRDGALVSTSTAPGGGQILRLSGPRVSGEPFELFALDFTTSSLLHYRDGVFRELERGQPIIVGDVVRDGPGSAWAALGDRSVILRFENERLIEQDPDAGNVGISAIAVHETLGPFAGTVAGRLYRRAGDAWTLLGDLGSNVESIAPYKDGVVLGGVNGFFGHWSERTGLCVEQLLPGTVEKLTAIGDDLAVTMSNAAWRNPEDSPHPTYASWMQRVQ